MLKPFQLQALAVVVRTGSFTDAGKELGYTSSAVSQQVAALERALGIRLVERKAQRIHCTPAGYRLAERGRQALEVLATLEEDVRALARGQSGRLRIGTALDPGAGLLAPTLRQLKASHPGLELAVDDRPPDELLDRVRLGSLDLALLYDYPASPRILPPELEARTLSQAPWQLLTPADWTNADALPRLSSHSWIVGLAGDQGPRALSVVCAAAGFTPRISAITPNHDVVLGLVSAGVGVGVLPPGPLPGLHGVMVRAFEAADATVRTIAVHRAGSTHATVHIATRTLHRVAHAAPGTPSDAGAGRHRVP
ncbi:MAG: LysR family transcriptional regulator [Marmoricola sp.]